MSPSDRAFLAERTRGVPRLRQRLEPAPPGGGGPVWVDDPGFAIDRYVRQVASARPGDRQALLDIGLGQVATPLSRDRPLWAAALVTGLADGAPVRTVLPLAVAEAGNLTVSFEALSYAGSLVVTAAAAADQVPDLDLLVASLDAAFRSIR